MKNTFSEHYHWDATEGLVGTPMSVANLMAATILDKPNVVEKLKQGTADILFPFMKSGSLAVALTKLMQEKIGVDISPQLTGIAEYRFIRGKFHDENPTINMSIWLENFLTMCESPDSFGDMKFDCALINPPFNGNIDLEFIQKAMKIADHVVVVHPAISSISRKDTKKFVEHKKLLDGHVKSIRMFNGNPMFGIGLFYPCQIVDIDTTKKYDSFKVTYDYSPLSGRVDTFKSLFDVTKWGNVPEYYSLEKKILEYCETKDNCENHLSGGPYKTSHTGKWIVNLPGIRGDVIRGDNGSVPLGIFHPVMWLENFFTMMTTSTTPSLEEDNHMRARFQTKTEAESFLAFLRSDFSRFCISITKNGANLHRGEFASVPYLPSYKEEWTKEKLTKLFQITDAEWAFIESVIPKYY